MRTTRARSLFLSIKVSFVMVFLSWSIPQFVLANPIETVLTCIEGAGAQSFPVGANTTGCSINTTADLDSFTFEGASGTSIRFIVSGAANNLDPRIEVRDPNGVVITDPNQSVCNASTFSTCAFITDLALTETGTYQVAVSENGLNNTGGYWISHNCLFGNCPGALALPVMAYDFNLTEPLTPPVDMDIFSFLGAAGTSIRFNVSGLSNNLDLRIEVRDPNGKVITDPSQSFCDASTFSTCSFATDLNLMETGTFQVAVREGGANNTGSYGISLGCLFGNCPTGPGNQVNEFNGDGNTDLFLAHNTGWLATGMLNNSVLGAFDFLLNLGLGWTVSGTGYFNSDEKSDVLLYNTTTGEYRILQIDGTTVVSDTVVATLDPVFGLSPFRMGDFNGDGRAEILVHDPTSGYTALLFFDSIGTNTSFEAVFQVDTANDWTLHDTGDFNGDRRLDLLLYNTVSGDSAIIEMNGSTGGPFTPIFTLDPVTGWTLKDTGDFTGDGKDDILILNTNGAIGVIEMNGTAFVSIYVPGFLQAGWKVVNVGHYDGDNKMDFLINDTTTGNLLTSIQDGTTVTGINVVFSPGLGSGWTPQAGK